MNNKTKITKKDTLALIACITFLLMTLGAVGPGGLQRQRNALCLANLQQWSLIWSTFFQDNDNKAIGTNNNDEDMGAEAWPAILKPYYNDNNKIMFCPQATQNDGLSYGDKYTAWNYGWVIGIEWTASYGVNDWVYNGPSSWGRNTGDFGWSSPDLPGTANVPLFLDCTYIGSFPHSASEAPPEADEYPFYNHTWIGKYCMDRHGRGRINGIFLDGSVRPIGLKELWKLKWHRQFDTNGPWTIAGGATPNSWPEWMKKLQRLLNMNIDV